MEKVETWIACGAVGTFACATGVALDRSLGTGPVLTATGVTAAAAYLTGTFAPRSRVFGRPASPRRDGGRFALTFDDGPDPRFTEQISAIVAERGHAATFFVLGRAARSHPEVVARVVADGHEIGNHGYDHRLLALTSPRMIRAQLADTEDAIRCATGRPPAPLFRPPHGARSPWLRAVVGQLGYQLCAWDGSVFDTALPGHRVIIQRVRSLLAPGAVILLHDGDGTGRGASRAQTVEALPAILDAAESRGLRSVQLGRMISGDPHDRLLERVGDPGVDDRAHSQKIASRNACESSRC